MQIFRQKTVFKEINFQGMFAFKTTKTQDLFPKGFCNHIQHTIGFFIYVPV